MTVLINPISRIRAIRLREDLRQIADLIELCFSQNIDAEGLEYIRHIRQTANNFSALILENTTPENSPLPFHGYVWVENEQIIGNVTLIPLRAKEKGSYFVANVAVHPNYRGRGIGKKLTERAIRHAREHQGKQVYLQVRDDNEIATRIYRELGFDEISRRTMWVYHSNSQILENPSSSVKITRREKEDWSQQKMWLESLYPREIHWNIPIRLEKMEPTFSNWITRFMYAEFQRSWSVRKNSKLIGAVTLDHNSESHDYCWLATSPIWEDEVIRAVFPVIEHKMLFPKRLAVNYPAGRARASFEAVGMRELNTLLWMKYRIAPFDESIIV
jgi:ribosomal protein S18 acetylase RimI-like enzyme